MASGRQRFSDHQRRAAHPAARHRSGRDARMGRLVRHGRRTRGRTRARYVMLRLLERAREQQVGVPGLRQHRLHQHHPARAASRGSPATRHRAAHPRLHPLERRRSWCPRQQRPGIGVGGHICHLRLGRALYEVGFNHFFRGKDARRSATRSSSRDTPRRASTPARSSRAGSTETSSTASGRRCRTPAAACPSYPHPRLMPDFWEFPTVSMGLGPLNAIYQARFNRYLLARGIKDTVASARVGVPRRRRDGRAGGARRDRPGRPRGARQPHLRHQLQPAAAGRPGPRQRQDHPGARGLLPRRGLERHQGHLGPRLGPAAGRTTPTACSSTR